MLLWLRGKCAVYRQLGMSGMGIITPEQNMLYCLKRFMTDANVQMYVDKQMLSIASEGAIS